MPTFVRILEKCSLCRKMSIQKILTSSSSFGPPDLDFRPSIPARMVNKFLIHKCPWCSYCNFDLSQEIPGAQKKIKESEYKRLLKERGMPKKARQFRCHAYLELENNRKNSLNSLLQSAWICDDRGFKTKSEISRRLAIDIIKELKLNPDSEEDLVILAQYIDLLRRVGEFNKAKLKCNNVLKDNKLPVLFKDIYDLQLELIKNQDMDVHRVPINYKKSDSDIIDERLAPLLKDLDIPDFLK